MMDALVTDVQITSAVAGMRGLGRAGCRVLALGDRWSAGGLWSRYACGRALAPDARADPQGFASRVFELARENGPVVVYPGGEPALSALLSAADRRPAQAVLPYPGPAADALLRLRDKRELAGLAAPAGLETPAVVARGTADELARGSVPTPCVVKPAVPGGAFSTAQVIESRPALEALLRGLDGATPLLVQERLRGALMMIAVVLGPEGQVVQRFQQVARRTWPPQAGASSLAISVAPDSRLVDKAADMLAAAGFSGLAQLDFLQIGRSPRLIDVNPRFYTSLPLALTCGVNLPAAWHAVATSRPLPPQPAYPTGVTYRWLEGDLLTAANRSPRVVAAGRQRAHVGAMWARDDPIPGTLLAGRAAVERLRRQLAQRAGHGTAESRD